MSSKYNKSFFLSDVREKANKSSLYSVQRELLRGLTDGLPERELDINNIYEGIEKFERHLKSAHVLLILDDIDHEDQLEALLSVNNVFRSDSFILITSRYKNVLERSGVKQLCIYQLRGLSIEHSQQLFCSYAFGQTYPFPEFEDLVNRFLEVCDGLPLALKVLGALLFTQPKSYWEAKLYELKVQMKVSADIKNRLKISYEALSEDEQKIFLDIAFFFIREKRTSAIAIWDASGWNGLLGLRNLEGKCLVEVDDKNVIDMHDQLRDLGRHIAEEETPRRLWRPTRNIDDLLTINVLTEARGIMMLPQAHSIELVMLSCYQRWSQQLLGNFLMQLICNSLYNIHYCFLGFDVMNLQLVETEGHRLDRILRVPSPNLIWLSWRHCPYTSLPSWITINNLRVLKVEGGVLETLWQSKSQAPLQLQELEIINASCLWSIPKSIGQLKHLERIVVLNAGSLKSLPDSLSKLTNLHSLDLKSCEKLERLPDSFGSLTNLHSLDLGSCQKLKRLSDSFGSLTNLHSLDLVSCKKLKRLPDSFGSLTNLHRLDLTWCEKLERLPDSFGSLTNLHSLVLTWCEKLERLPDSFGSLTNLHSLDLESCQKLERLPDSFGSLTNLHSLVLRWCQKLERLPDSFGSLTNLHSLDLESCEKLERLPDSFGSLTNLHSLALRWCKKLERLPDSLRSLTALKYFEASSCASLRISSETFGNIRTLEHIDLSGCGKVEVFPWQLAHQRSLKTLKLIGTNFKEMPSAIELPRDLEVLWMGNPFLERVMPSLLGDLLNLKELHLEYRGELKCLSVSVERSSELSWLKVAGCPIIHTSELFYDSNVVYPKLEKLILEECINLAEVGTLPMALTEVTLIGCDNLRSIEGLCGLAMLRNLHIRKCNELEELPSVKTMVSLEELHASDCVNLKSIRDLRWLTKLTFLNVHRCPQLGELEGVADCISLRWFIVKGCPKLRLDERVVERLRQKCMYMV